MCLICGWIYDEAAGLPDDVIRARVSDERSAVITLTHDPRVDDMALIEALESPAFYVGALGSQRTTDKRLERLRELDVPDAAIARLHAPIGLPIGSHAPMEIAVAIAAELIAARNGALAGARAGLLDNATRHFGNFADAASLLVGSDGQFLGTLRERRPGRRHARRAVGHRRQKQVQTGVHGFY